MYETLTSPPVVWGIICIAAAVTVYLMTLIAPAFTDHEACQPAESAYYPESCGHCAEPIEKGQSIIIDTVHHSVVHSQCEMAQRGNRRLAELTKAPTGAENN